MAVLMNLAVPCLASQVIISPTKDYDQDVAKRIASSNGNWDHLAVNRLASTPVGQASLQVTWQ